MGLDVPAIYAVYPRQEQPIHCLDEQEVVALLGKLSDWKNPADAGICICTCRNYWHQGLLKKICKGANIEAVDFIWEIPSYATLIDTELDAAQQGIKQLFNLLKSELPDLGEWEDEGIQDFRYCRDLSMGRKIETENDDPRQYLNAFKKAEVQLYIDSESWGFEANRSFCSHIKTLHFKIHEAIEKDAYFVYVLLRA
ncbi:MAG: hypothetical protein F6K00_04050 [Leptolyngbya sp. SIOISBB]|nr:hypothetical protein [Leptolyngbya sp. SIOISBB]